MGTAQTKESLLGMGHPSQFYEGCTAAQGGAYTLAEIAFHQAMVAHPGHAFWTRMMGITISTAGTGASNSTPAASPASEHPPNGTHPLFPDGLPTMRRTGEQRARSVLRTSDGVEGLECGVAESREAWSPQRDESLVLTDYAPPRGEEGEGAAGAQAEPEEEEAERRPTLMIPVDHRLVDVQDYVRMLTDIGRIYRRKAAASTGASREMSCRLSMLYNAYTAVRLEALITVFRMQLSEQNTECDPRAEDKFHIYAQFVMNAQWRKKAFKVKLTHEESAVGDASVNVGSQHASAGSEAADRTHDADLCVLWQTVEYLKDVNVLSYVKSALQLMDTTAMSPATQKAVLEMCVRCFKATAEEMGRTTEMNKHTYLGGLLNKFLVQLQECTAECRPSKQRTSKFGLNTHAGNHAQRTVKELVPKFLRLGPVNLAEKQTTFLRTAMYFPVTTLPLLDTASVVPVVLELQHNGNRSGWRLMSPADRSYGWYMNLSDKSRAERRLERPGSSAFLLQRCGVPPKPPVNDPTLFSCVGLEEMATFACALAAGVGVALSASGNTARKEELGKATYQLAVDIYGGPTPLAETCQACLAPSDGDAAEIV